MDLLVEETGNGGDLKFAGGDLVTVQGLESMVYLALFGGRDFWGNSILQLDNDNAVFQCETEKVLNETTLNSAGRIRIEEAVRADLAFIKKELPGTEVDVQVYILSDDKLTIKIWINGDVFDIQWTSPQKQITQVQLTAKWWWRAEDIVGSGSLASWTGYLGGLSFKANVFPPPNTGAAVINGYTVIEFDGTTGMNCDMGNGDTLDLSHTNKCTVMMVLQQLNSVSTPLILSMADIGSDYDAFSDTFAVVGSATGTRVRMPDGSGGFNGSSSGPQDGNFHIYEFSFDRSTFPKTYIDGILTGVNTGGTTLSGNFGNRNLRLGGSGGVECNVADILIWDNVIDAAERALITAYLQNKFAL